MATVPEQAKGRGTLRNLKTAVSARIRSKPIVSAQCYLELYILQRDRSRWRRLRQQADKSIRTIDSSLHEITALTEREAASHAVDATAAVRSTPGAKKAHRGRTGRRQRNT